MRHFERVELMGLEARGGGLYFYRKVRRGGRVVSEYGGRGLVALAISQDAQVEAAERRERAALDREERKRLADQERDLVAYCKAVDRLVADALLAAGFHRPGRHRWRKRRAHGPGQERDGSEAARRPQEG